MTGKRIAVLAALALAGCALPGVLVPEGDLLRAVHLRGAPDVPTVALTFDDGPNGRCTADLLDALAALGVPAAFFVLGANVDAGGNDEVLARMVREGHAIGLHGYHHEGRLLVVPAVLHRQLADTRRAVRAALARAGVAEAPALRFYRPPFGFLTARTADAAACDGFTIVLWTVSVGDWRRDATADAVVERVMARVGPGDVIVLHDGDRTAQRSRAACIDREVVVDAVRLLVPRLRARGLRPAPLAEVLGLPEPGAP